MFCVALISRYLGVVIALISIFSYSKCSIISLGLSEIVSLPLQGRGKFCVHSEYVVNN